MGYLIHCGVILTFVALVYSIPKPEKSKSCENNCLPLLPPPPPDSPYYSVALDNYGPEPTIHPPIEHPHVIAPTRHEPLKILPHPPIPPPKLLSHKIVHYKTYLKPQVYQRIITVPKVYRFLRKGVHPVVENIQYKAKPIFPPIESVPQVLGQNCLAPQTLTPCKPLESKFPTFPPLPQFVC